MKSIRPALPLLPLILLLAACTASPASPTSALPPTRQPSPVATATSSRMPCTVLHVPVTPVAFGAEAQGRSHVSGPANAPVTIVLFSDYQCPACALMAANLKKILQVDTQDVRLVLIDTPLASRDKDELTVQAAAAAELQGKFWEMHDLLFEKQADWLNLAPADFETWATRQAAGLGLDPVRFASDFHSQAVVAQTSQAVQATQAQGLTPPVLFVNQSTPYTGLADFVSLNSVIRMEALAVRQFSACPPWVIDPVRQYLATLHTAKGDVVIQLFPDKAPLAVNNFVYLARQGWFDQITFHRVVPNLIVQSGDPSGTGIGNPGYLFETELPAGLNFSQPGMLAMDNNGPNTNGSLFFITLTAADQIDGQYTIFGQVLSGLDTLAALTARDPRPGVYLPPGDELIGMTIQEK